MQHPVCRSQYIKRRARNALRALNDRRNIQRAAAGDLNQIVMDIELQRAVGVPHGGQLMTPLAVILIIVRRQFGVELPAYITQALLEVRQRMPGHQHINIAQASTRGERQFRHQIRRALQEYDRILDLGRELTQAAEFAAYEHMHMCYVACMPRQHIAHRNRQVQVWHLVRQQMMQARQHSRTPPLAEQRLPLRRTQLASTVRIAQHRDQCIHGSRACSRLSTAATASERSPLISW